MKKLVLTATVIIPLLFSCGGPEFSVGYRYVPPNNNGKCLKACQEKFTECQEKCAKERDKCLKDARKRAEAVYQKELDVYEKELEAYNRAYNDYQRALLNWNNSYRKLYRDYLYFKRACKKTKDYYACNRRDQLEEALETLNEQKPVSPTPPKKPNLSDIVSELSSNCYTDCGCKEVYNSCFTSCGGEIIPYKFCVKNCK